MQARCGLGGSAQALRAVPGSYPVRHRKPNQSYPTNQPTNRPTNQIPEQGPKLSNQPKGIFGQRPRSSYQPPETLRKAQGNPINQRISLGRAHGYPTNQQKPFGRPWGTCSTKLVIEIAASVGKLILKCLQVESSAQP